MASIARSIARIKQDALGALGRGVIEKVCAEFGHAWRDRELDPATTIALFVQQVLHGNVACSEVRHLAAAADKTFTPSAYCQARARLPLAVVQSLLTRAFGQPDGQAPGCGFPVAHLLVLFHAQTGLLLDAWASRLRTGDITQVAKAHAQLSAGDVLIGDEAFCSYAHLAMLMKLG